MQATVKTLAFALIISSSAHSQSTTEWSIKHPEVLLIESQDASAELLDRLDQSSAKYIVYTDELLMEDIEIYNQKQSASGLVELIDPSQVEAEYLKTWISQHSNTKIIRRSYYESLDSERQRKYHSGNIMILEGEFITYGDIENFQNSQSETN